MRGDSPTDRAAGAVEFDPASAHLVFVYGTLTDPERVEAVLETDRFAFRGAVTLVGLRRVDGEYPTLVPGGPDRDHSLTVDDSRPAVNGRLLAVDDAGLESLDAYEGVDRGLYVRVAVPARLSAIDAEEAWCYVGDPDRLDAPGTWPGNAGFESRVRDALDDSEAFVTDATGTD
ncbi:gamma-glutamylcyclotransferase family protein [Halovivax limisalsi]|uniref:gamma-glutamylcyclotransferase family protein n=1 Tax=Halovivax limisalsi TaxID=1453760 RepID=UPI002495925A|nr:gamma-glutamylcyclotransferase family protein [Halovivax limisalsi]